MNYLLHREAVIQSFPELKLHLLNYSEFEDFSNFEFASECVQYCIDFCNEASQRLNIKVNFGIVYNHAFNATAYVQNNNAAITFNFGLIEKLENIISETLEIFFSENIASLTVNNNEKKGLKKLIERNCIAYLFYHELAHVLQTIYKKSRNKISFQEQYPAKDEFCLKSHHYEIDADYFGALMSIYLLMQELEKNSQINNVKLFNYLTALIFSISNIIIIFSNNDFRELYYWQHKHPHPFIRIIICLEQMISFVAGNYHIQNQLLETVLQRNSQMISQLKYSREFNVNYSKIFVDNSVKIENYINEIEVLNHSYEELTRFKSQEIFNKLLD